MCTCELLGESLTHFWEGGRLSNTPGRQSNGNWSRLVVIRVSLVFRLGRVIVGCVESKHPVLLIT